MTSARQAALTILTTVLRQHRALSDVFSQQLPELAEAEHPLCKQLCFGVMREYFLIQQLLSPLLKKPLKAKDTDVLMILYLGIYQLVWLQTAEHAAIHATVDLTKSAHKPWASKLVNAILRRVQRQQPEIPGAVPASHPAWLCTQLQQDWPDDWQHIITANQKHPPMTIRVNGNVHEYQALLAKQDIKTTLLPQCPTALVLAHPVPVHTLPGFATGVVSVQDAAAQQVAPLMDLSSGLRVLDACAAPGGKTSHMLTLSPDIHMFALDNKTNRLEKLQHTLARHHLQATCVLGDAQGQDWWDGFPFDRILCDVPCSATGIIRRQPDVKVLRTPEEIQALQISQQAILNNCWQMLKPGGYLLYTTCSVLHAENDAQIEAFLAKTDTAHCVSLPTIPSRTTTYGVQSLPGEEGQDGFYYAKLQKTQ